MIFGNRTRPETSYKGNSEPSSGGLAMSPLIAVVIISIAGASMVGSYLLGFRAGHTNGLELALANSVSHVVRSPIAKSSIEPSNTNTDSSDVYAKLKESSALHQEAQTKQADVSKEVKNFLQPTATPSQKLVALEANTAKEAEAAQKLAAASNTAIINPVVQEKKQADTAAIQRALNEAKSEEEFSLNTKTKEDKAVRVIGGVGQEAESEISQDSDKANKITEKEDFSEIPPVEVSKKQANNIKQDLGVKQPTAKITDSTNKKVVEKNDLKTKSTQSAKVIEAPAKQENKKSDNSIKSSGLAPGWYSQVAAPRSLAEAQAISGKLRSAGFKARIETAEVRDEQYYRVVVGPEVNRLAADQVLMKLKKQSSVKTEPFIRMVK